MCLYLIIALIFRFKNKFDLIRWQGASGFNLNQEANAVLISEKYVSYQVPYTNHSSCNNPYKEVV